MKRRTFIKTSALYAVAVSTTGFVRFDGTRYKGDCETTSDIIGPYYRPGAPVRNDLTIKGAAGDIALLSGTIFHKDCKTPIENASIEIWHCSHEQEYDNNSPEFRYRGKAFTDAEGKYFFRTILPVPYKTGAGKFRPAHYHLLISAAPYQDLVTQIYFTGDPYLATDEYSSSPQAQKRILSVGNGSNGEKQVSFDVVMAEKVPASAAVIAQLSGTYADVEKKQDDISFSGRNNQLWVFYGGEQDDLEYVGNNTFKSFGEETYGHFELLTDGNVKVTVSVKDDRGNSQTVFVGLKKK